MTVNLIKFKLQLRIANCQNSHICSYWILKLRTKRLCEDIRLQSTIWSMLRFATERAGKKRRKPTQPGDWIYTNKEPLTGAIFLQLGKQVNYNRIVVTSVVPVNEIRCDELCHVREKKRTLLNGSFRRRLLKINHKITAE